MCLLHAGLVGRYVSSVLSLTGDHASCRYCRHRVRGVCLTGNYASCGSCRQSETGYHVSCESCRQRVRGVCDWRTCFVRVL